jgi:hypothetical protein
VVIFLSVTCMLLIAFTEVMARSYRRQLRARRDVTDRVLAKTQEIAAQHEVYRQEYLDMAANSLQQYEDLSAHLEASYADALTCAEQRWGGQLSAIQREYDASLARMRTQQSTALARLQRRMPQPEVLRLHGDQRL